jgi:hypothetical protein
MSCRRFVLAFGAVVGAGLGAAMFTSPAAYAVDELPPGTVGPTGPATGVIDYEDLSPFFIYHQATWPKNFVDDNGNVVGTLDETRTSWDASLIFMGAHSLHNVVENGTGTAAAWDGAVHDTYTLVTFAPLGGYLTIFGNEYLQTPEGASDYVTLFNNEFPIFDTFPADSSPTVSEALAQVTGSASDLTTSMGSDTADTGWLADLGQLLDVGSLL